MTLTLMLAALIVLSKEITMPGLPNQAIKYFCSKCQKRCRCRSSPKTATPYKTRNRYCGNKLCDLYKVYFSTRDYGEGEVFYTWAAVKKPAVPKKRYNSKADKERRENTLYNKYRHLPSLSVDTRGHLGTMEMITRIAIRKS